MVNCQWLCVVHIVETQTLATWRLEQVGMAAGSDEIEDVQLTGILLFVYQKPVRMAVTLSQPCKFTAERMVAPFRW